MTLEKDNWRQGNTQARFYYEQLEKTRKRAESDIHRKKIIKPSEMPWEDTPHGRIKHIVNGNMSTRMNTVDAYIQELPPGGSSGKHRHMAEECLYILEGVGYDLHWDVEADIQDVYQWKVSDVPDKWEWEASDCVYIPPNTAHQHFNASDEKPARFISARNSVYQHIGFGDLEQLEVAPK